MTGALTFTGVGTFDVSGANLKTAIDKLNCGAATAGAETTSLIFIPTANGMRVTVFQIARAA